MVQNVRVFSSTNMWKVTSKTYQCAAQKPFQFLVITRSSQFMKQITKAKENERLDLHKGGKSIMVVSDLGLIIKSTIPTNPTMTSSPKTSIFLDFFFMVSKFAHIS
jgi:hypothetical protein